MKIFIPILIFVIALVLLLFVFGYFCFHRACRRSPRRDPAALGRIKTEKYGAHEQRMKKLISEYEKEKKESVRVTSHDSLSLYASYIEAPARTDKLIIAFHGYRSSAAAEFSPVYRALLDAGYSLLLVDQRSHGRSEGKYIGFGALERYDVRTWCDYAQKRFGNNVKIYLYGISMGAATVTMASSLGLAPNVRAIVADCGFTSPFDIIKNTLRYKNKIFPYPTIFFMNFFSRVLAGYDFKSVSSPCEIAKSSLPLLIIHGQKDRYVPCAMSQVIYNARQDSTELVLFEEATHARSHLSYTEKYISALRVFLERN